MSFRGSWDCAGSDTASDTSSWTRGPSFASSENLQSAARSLQSALKGLGFSSRLNLLAGSPEDIANTLNCIHQLLERLHHEQLLREDAHVEHRRIKGELQTAESTLQKLRREIEIKERDIGTLQNKDRQMQASHHEELVSLIRDRDSLQKECNNLSQRQHQFQHEIRRKELEYEWLQEKLRRYLAERKKESEASMEIVGRWRKQRRQSERGRIASKLDDLMTGRNTVPSQSNRMPKLDESMVKMIVTAYEEKQQELIAENKDLQNALNSVRKEYAQMMNTSREGTGSPLRRSADGGSARIFITNYDRIAREEDSNLQNQKSLTSESDDHLKDVQLESQPSEVHQSSAPVFASPKQEKEDDESEANPRQSDLVPWPIAADVPLRTKSEHQDLTEVDSESQGQALDSKSDDHPVDFVHDNLGAVSPLEGQDERPQERESGLPTVCEEPEELQDSARTEKELSIKSIQESLALPDPTKASEAPEEKSETPEKKSEIQTEVSPATNQQSSLLFDSPSSTRDAESKLENAFSQESRPLVKASPFESAPSPNSETPVPVKESRMAWPPASTVSTPPRDNPSPPRRRKTFKLPEPMKPVPNVAHISEEQLRKELRTRAVFVEESVRALKTACTSMKPQDMKTVMERRLYMEFQMAANLAEQQEAVVNLAVAGLEKAKRLGPISDTEWGVAAQSVSNSVDKSEELVAHLNSALEVEGSTDKEQVSSLIQQFQTHFNDIRKEIQEAKNRIMEKTSSFADRAVSTESADALERNISSLRERADVLSKERTLLTQEMEDIDGNVHSTPPRRTWENSVHGDPRKPNGGQDGYYSDEEATEDRNLGDILLS